MQRRVDLQIFLPFLPTKNPIQQRRASFTAFGKDPQDNHKEENELPKGADKTMQQKAVYPYCKRS